MMILRVWSLGRRRQNSFDGVDLRGSNLSYESFVTSEWLVTRDWLRLNVERWAVTRHDPCTLDLQHDSKSGCRSRVSAHCCNWVIYASIPSSWVGNILGKTEENDVLKHEKQITRITLSEQPILFNLSLIDCLGKRRLWVPIQIIFNSTQC